MNATFLFLALWISACQAACSVNKNCASCVTTIGCGWCDAGSFGNCQNVSVGAVDFCPSLGGTKYLFGCPNKCAYNQINIDYGLCKIAAGWKAQSIASCNAVNLAPLFQSTTGRATTGTLDKCSAALATDGARCAGALMSFECSFGCQRCTDGGASLKLCKSVCDKLKAACPNVAKDCLVSPFPVSLCAADEFDCAADLIESVSFSAAAPTTTTNTLRAVPTSTTTTTTTTTAAATMPATSEASNKSTTILITGAVVGGLVALLVVIGTVVVVVVIRRQNAAAAAQPQESKRAASMSYERGDIDLRPPTAARYERGDIDLGPPTATRYERGDIVL